MLRERFTIFLGPICALALVAVGCGAKKPSNETVAVNPSAATASASPSATVDIGATPSASPSASPIAGASGSPTPAAAGPVTGSPAPTAAPAPSVTPAPTTPPTPSSTAASTPAPQSTPPIIPGGPVGTPVASGSGSEGTKAETVRSYFSKTFGIPGFKPPWYDALTTISVQGDTVTALSTLDADSAGRESAVRMCDALAGFVFAPDSSSLGINRIVVRAKDNTQLVTRTGLAGVCGS